MVRNRRHVLSAVALAGLVATLMLSGASTGNGAPPPATQDVRVVNTTANPVPVSGSVGAQQAGAWNVGIAGTPTVALAPGAGVVVGNTTASPLPVRDVDNSARQPFQKVITVQLPPGVGFVSQTFEVPAGKRWVVETVSVEAFVGPDERLVVRLRPWDGGESPSDPPVYSLTPEAQFRFDGFDHLGINQQVRIYTPPGPTGALAVWILRYDLNSPASDTCTVGLVGYLVDVP